MIISWDNYFMGIAKLSSLRSKDPSTQVGACIVNADNRIVGIGYNGFPKDCEDDDFPWEPSENTFDSKYTYVVHAELNAILNSNSNLVGCRMYVTHFPCNECAKAIIQSGINEVVYEAEIPRHSEITKPSRRMFAASGIAIRKMEYESIVLDSIKM